MHGTLYTTRTLLKEIKLTPFKSMLLNVEYVAGTGTSATAAAVAVRL